MPTSQYPFNFIRKLYGDDKDDNTHAHTVYLKGLFEQLRTLTEQEQNVISWRYEQNLTLQQCGKKLGVTLERARQIEQKAFRKLRHAHRKNQYEGIPKHTLSALKQQRDTLKNENVLLKTLLEHIIQGDISPERIVPIYQTDPQTEKLKTPLEKLGLSTRSYNALFRSNIRTLGDIIALSEKELRNIRNLGEQSIKEIKTIAYQYGLTLNATIDREVETVEDLKHILYGKHPTRHIKIRLDCKKGASNP